jgi:hypothetical protein
MGKQETLDILDKIYDQMSSMAEDELLNYLMEGSESYKRIIESQILTVKVENSCIESTLNKAIETAGTYISVKETDDSVSSPISRNDQWAKAA